MSQLPLNPQHGELHVDYERQIVMQWESSHNHWVSLGPIGESSGPCCAGLPNPTEHGARGAVGPASPSVPPGPPPTIRVGHLVFALEWVQPTEMPVADSYGCCDKPRLTIFVQKNLPPSLTVDVIMHELIHAMYFVYGIPHKIKEENACLVFTSPIVSLLKDNPALVTWAKSMLSL